ncbi:ABC transporter permease [Psychromarinibacter halotolerans]|uniref:ABC transporter permease n=1 Tax=Psychromarinibacter halotolerans TaxID=1775175 RepID=A0ABV7GS48_9RHOB|nr:ABC transporter permease [Psychromarinibacter halotolerans]MDF0597614.1 ABC transporter permease [Psychromarinibacter halotolerans]
MRSFLPFILRRLARAILVVLAVAVINFVIIQSAPGDAASVLAGEAGAGDTQYVEDLREQLGLDRPFHVQLGRYMSSLLTGDLGYSMRHNMPVVDLIMDRLPATILLVVVSILFATVVGSLMGLLAGFNRGKWPDMVVSVLALIGYATPLFWLGLMLVMIFSLNLRLLPSSGMATVGAGGNAWDHALDVGRHLIMPATTLGLFYLATYARIVRASTLDILGMDYVKVAISKGASRLRIAIFHVMRNAMLPVLTIFGVQFATALGGAVVIEVVFGWPGIGRLAQEALLQRDVNLLLGVLFFSAILVSLVNLIVDILYTVVDPRITLQ